MVPIIRCDGRISKLRQRGGRTHGSTELKVDAVFFDAGNTLIYPDPPVGRVYARALHGAGVEADPEEVGRRFEQSWVALRKQRAAHELEYGSTEEEAIVWWRKVVLETCRHFGVPEEFEDMFRELWGHFASGAAWSVFDDVLPTLGELRGRGKSLGVISNWDVRLADVLREMGLWDRFDWVLVSACVGAEKPDLAIFRRALQRCRMRPERVLHVGDSYEDDLLGARRAGLKALWLRRDKADCAGEAIGSLSELTELVE